MANNKSSRKRIKTSSRNRLKNQFYKTSIKTLKKKLKKKIEKYTELGDLTIKTEGHFLINRIFSLLDKSGKRKVFHKKTINRKKSQLTSIYQLLQNNPE